MSQSDDHPPSFLFTVRIWPANPGDGQVEWRGRVQLLPHGDVCYFRDWNALVDLLKAQCQDGDRTAGTGPRSDGEPPAHVEQ